MALRASRLMAERLKEMLTRDKLGVKEGFVSSLCKDTARLLGDYFELEFPPEVRISAAEEGGYEISVKALASDVKRFETTADFPKPEY